MTLAPDIAIYSTLAMILYRKSQDEEYAKKTLSENGYEDWKNDGKPRLGYDFVPVDDKLQSDMDSDHSIIAMRRAAEKQQEEEEARS